MNQVMKMFLIVFYLIVCSSCYSQMKNISLQVKGYDYREVKVGESMPDIPLGTVLNNNNGIRNFSELKGKLVILDFWDTRCGSCIAAFPQMDQLQKQFGDQIQIVLVNSSETEEVIKDRFRKIPALKRLKMPDLPSIVNAKYMDSLFPHEGTPFHIWIDSLGIVRFRGSHLNTHEEKIKKFLEGKQVDFVNEGIKYSGDEPLHTALKSSLADQKYSSLITGFTDNVKDIFGNKAFVNKIDSNAGTIRSTYVNRDLAQLYVDAVENEMDSIWKKNLNIRGGSYIGKFDLIVKDTLMYTPRFLPAEKWTDEVFRKSKFCYEQIVPFSISASTRKKYMLEDLNRYFGSLYGVVGSIKTERKLCYVLVRTSNIDKLKSSESNSGFYISTVNGRKVKEYRGYLVKDIIYYILSECKDVSKKDLLRVGDVLLDETGYSEMANMVIPDVFDGGINNLDELRTALRNYDLDIVLTERDVKTFVLKER